MLWKRVVETWQSISGTAWTSGRGGADDLSRETILGAAEGSEITSGGGGEQEQPSSRLRRRHDAEQIHTNSLHMSS